MTRWEPAQSADAVPTEQPSFWTSLSRGACNRCPACGVGKVFSGWLKIVPECTNCHAPLGAYRADDAPPYFTIFLAGHLLVPGVLMIERAYHPPMWVHMVVWLPFFTIACILLLRPVKGAVIGWMMRLGITGTETGVPVADPPPRVPRDA